MVSIGALGGAIVLMVVIMIDDLGPAQTQSGDPLTPYRAQRETYLEKYRVEGRIEHELLIPAASGIAALVQNSRRGRDGLWRGSSSRADAAAALRLAPAGPAIRSGAADDVRAGR